MLHKKKIKSKLIPSLLVIPLILSVVGLFFVFEASSVKAFSQLGDSFHFLKLQAVWVAISLGVMVFFSLFDYHKLYYLSFLSMLITIGFLIAVLIPGIGNAAGGARRWIDLGIINFQPTELAKFSVVVYLSSWFINRERKRFFSFLILLGLLIGLIMLQPDMGTAVILFLLSIIIYFLAGIELHWLLFLIPASFFGFLLLIKTSAYRARRLLAFVDPARDPLGVSYHINQILISLGHGGVFGQGLGASRQKYLYLPEAHTDSIFAIIAEEFGFFGSLFLIVGFVLFLSNIYRIVEHSPDRFGKLLSGGIMAYFGLQIVINLFGMTALMPLTGVPLPFISYGGSNLLVSYALIGILINIAKKAGVAR